MHGYQVIRPHSDIGKSKRKNVCDFLNADATFSTAPSDTEDTILVYKINPVTEEIYMTASFIVFQRLTALVAFVALIKVNQNKQGEGMGSAFFGDLAEYMEKETRGKLYSGSYFVVHRVKALKSHAFYEKLGFVDAPPNMQSWKLDGADLAVCDIEKFIKSEAFAKLAVCIFPPNLI
jgi:predicted GNAT superfamily acetyltransferase